MPDIKKRKVDRVSWRGSSSHPVFPCGLYHSLGTEPSGIDEPEGHVRFKEPGNFETFRRRFYDKKWVVYCKPPFGGPKGVLQYLGRYTHRIAISNNRILANRDGHVSFLWRDYADDNRQKTMTLKADEFIRRFLLHVLPERYVRIRHFGLLANRNRKNNIVLCRKILGDCKAATKEKIMKETWQEQSFRICDIDVTTCPVCQKGKMFRMAPLLPYRCNGP